MRIAMGHVDDYDDTVATFARQLGLRSVQLHCPSNLSSTDADYWPLAELTALRQRCERDGLVLEGLENVPAHHFSAIQRGGPGRDQQIESYQRAIRNLGAVGIPLLGYHFMATYVWRTDMAARGRGAAAVTSFDLDKAAAGNALASYKLSPTADPTVDADDAVDLDAGQMWANNRYFLDAVLPVAEEVGVRLALHPDDPPVDRPLGGAARIFTSPESIERAYYDAHGSSAWGLNFCVGTFSEAGGQAAVLDVIDRLGPKDAIAYVHFRDVVGTVPSFHEGFLGEGNLDPAVVLRHLSGVGFDGFVIDDHVPAMVGDVATWGDTSSRAYSSRARAHAIGYLQGVFNALQFG